MIKLDHKKILFILFIIWAVLWANFTIRDLTKKKYFKEYKVLLARDAAGKTAYTYGDSLFNFLQFCEKSIPDVTTYDLAGLEEGSIDQRRVIYYLYPRCREKKADYVLVFGLPGYTQEGYKNFKELDPSNFILKRIR